VALATPLPRRRTRIRAADVLRRRPQGWTFQITGTFVNPGGPAVRTCADSSISDRRSRCTRRWQGS
jgi:hypothetical protein